MQIYCAVWNVQQSSLQILWLFNSSILYTYKHIYFETIEFSNVSFVVFLFNSKNNYREICSRKTTHKASKINVLFFCWLFHVYLVWGSDSILEISTLFIGFIFILHPFIDNIHLHSVFSTKSFDDSINITMTWCFSQ